ncbi:MAG: hypothetical protein Ta2D_01850 [Rickettsiales bacterium]|nr:MAG: hypothetical protein Ta2D_01850 [Rickettsiales bacterium]
MEITPRFLSNLKNVLKSNKVVTFNAELDGVKQKIIIEKKNNGEYKVINIARGQGLERSSFDLGFCFERSLKDLKNISPIQINRVPRLPSPRFMPQFLPVMPYQQFFIPYPRFSPVVPPRFSPARPIIKPLVIDLNPSPQPLLGENKKTREFDKICAKYGLSNCLGFSKFFNDNLTSNHKNPEGRKKALKEGLEKGVITLDDVIKLGKEEIVNRFACSSFAYHSFQSADLFKNKVDLLEVGLEYAKEKDLSSVETLSQIISKNKKNAILNWNECQNLIGGNEQSQSYSEIAKKIPDISERGKYYIADLEKKNKNKKLYVDRVRQRERAIAVMR